MKPLLIVDGYNLIHQSASYKRLREEDLESARARLVEDLAAYSTLTDYEIYVIFDAAQTDSKERHRASILGVDVWFSRSGESADSVIERLSYDESAVRRVVVATSDYAQQKVIFRPGVTIKSARQLIVEMDEIFNEAKEVAEELQTKKRMPRLEERIDHSVKRALDRLIKGF